MLRLVQRRVAASLRTQCSRMMSSDSSDDAFNRPRSERALNKVQLIGRVGRDPEYRGSDEYRFYVFPLATSLTIRKANGEYNVKTDWHRIAVFRPGLRDNVASRIAKGDRLYVEGSLSYVRIADDKGTTNITSIIANDIMLLQQKYSQEDSEEHEDL